MQGVRVWSLVWELDPTCMPQLRVQKPQLRSPPAATKTQHNQINKYLKKKKKRLDSSLTSLDNDKDLDLGVISSPAPCSQPWRAGRLVAGATALDWPLEPILVVSVSPGQEVWGWMNTECPEPGQNSRLRTLIPVIFHNVMLLPQNRT